MTAGDEPILNGVAVFRSSSLRLRAQDTVLLGGFTYSVLAASVRGLGELVDKWDAAGVDVTVYANGRKVGGLPPATLQFLCDEYLFAGTEKPLPWCWKSHAHYYACANRESHMSLL
ncbi:MAG: hypothetical protein Q9213_005627 [Squamulea squamosa]